MRSGRSCSYIDFKKRDIRTCGDKKIRFMMSCDIEWNKRTYGNADKGKEAY
jgi:hypothetical protein